MVFKIVVFAVCLLNSSSTTKTRRAPSGSIQYDCFLIGWTKIVRTKWRYTSKHGTKNNSLIRIENTSYPEFPSCDWASLFPIVFTNIICFTLAHTRTGSDLTSNIIENSLKRTSKKWKVPQPEALFYWKIIKGKRWLILSSYLDRLKHEPLLWMSP